MSATTTSGARHGRAFATVALLGAVALASATVSPSAAGAARTAAGWAGMPTAAVALGDSFISGEGGGDYQQVVDLDGVAQGFPGWTAENTNAYFCHRSAHASLLQAELPGIDARFNLACSGGQPHDLADASIERPKGRTVAAQLDQLRTVAQTHDIDLVLVGIGSNNSFFTFGNVASTCANRFIADAWTGVWEVWTWLGGPIEEKPCSLNDLATDDELEAGTAETVNAVRRLLTTLDEVDHDGQHRVVFQDYTNPLPPDLDPKFHKEDNRDDRRDKFRALGAERYAGGCPVHRASLAPGHAFSSALGTLVQQVRDTMAAEFPAADLVKLDVQHAFDGARLCESAGSPAGTLATPIRLRTGSHGALVNNLSGYDKLAIQDLASNCVKYFQTCQESWHPNASGYAVLGRCLSAAAATAARSLSCVRSDDGTITVQ